MMGVSLEEPSDQRIVFNVSGYRFVTTRETLLKQPGSKLARIAASADNHWANKEFFFDADDEVFRELLRYCRTGRLHIPGNMCAQSFLEQLAEWEIDGREKLADCCKPENEAKMEKEFRWFEKRAEPNVPVDAMSWRWHVWYFLTDPYGPYTKYPLPSKLWTLFYLITIILYVIAYGLWTLPISLKAVYNVTSILDYYELSETDECKVLDCLGRSSTKLSVVDVCVAFFGVEILFRLLVCPDKLHFLKSMNMMDVVISMTEMATYFSPEIISGLQQRGVDRTSCKVLLIVISVSRIASTLRIIRFVTVASKLR